MASSERYGFEIGALYNYKKWLRLNFSINGYQFVYKGDFNGVNYDSEDTALATNFSSKISLPYKIDWQTNVKYNAGRNTAQTAYLPRYDIGLAFSKEINEKATLSFTVKDLLNSRRRRFTTTTDEFSTTGDIQFRERQFNLTFLYRINQKKERKKGKRGKNGKEDKKPTGAGATEEEGEGY